MTIKPLSCPRCGSPDLEERTWNRRRCRHCGTESVLSSDRTRLQLVEWVCPSCGFNNESGTAFCGQCGAALTKQCPECSHQIRIDLQFCNFCGANYEGVLAERLRQRREEGIAALEKSRKARTHGLLWRAPLLGFVAWFVFLAVLMCPLVFLPSGGAWGSVTQALIWVVLIGSSALAILFAWRMRSRMAERIEREFASKRRALEESLAQEYAEKG